uniref:Uncharacterized protein n=1 Tax=Chromera velia CCMP2878 TaxID=1169474 RepID=A0A0G4GJ26_9ALVE|eukprot:Cvel_22109.t1-p1 / transcript=Cvel_22109.t1 / gene=Cvel_22109 / organism=Chromera_velia_CCMP2878 / gene_product=Probable N-acetylgalactosaminyltransferase 9, putative / transcript_product=Probable N-acetylgalactosaminyltransferase 9, putative / location=Cvel_scaffold2141:16672-23327(+) / protein_length=704 / sequence_SO=supercontig / SO=protein_coding / is_pseudo=false
MGKSGQAEKGAPPSLPPKNPKRSLISSVLNFAKSPVPFLIFVPSCLALAFVQYLLWSRLEGLETGQPGDGIYLIFPCSFSFHGLTGQHVSSSLCAHPLSVSAGRSYSSSPSSSSAPPPPSLTRPEDQRNPLLQIREDPPPLYRGKPASYFGAEGLQGWSLLRQHGIVGLLPNGKPGYERAPTPPPQAQLNMEDEMRKGGGFHRRLSDSLPLDRPIRDFRDTVCKRQEYDVPKMSEWAVSVIITFLNEPMSTLLRSVHSVLNRTPPALLKEIVLIDDGSTAEWLLDPLDRYINNALPDKVRLVRLPQNRGLMGARLAGAEAAEGRVIMILDSHIEVQPQWLEPILSRISEGDDVVVTPQIDAIQAVDFDFTSSEGIGCYLDFKWTLVERAYLTGGVTSAETKASPVMAGGLWAMKRELFFRLGGYDPEFSVWGAEHLEFSFRIWLCGARLECAPCSRISHVFRKGEGRGYKIPLEAVWKNRLRTAAIWMDDFAEISEAYNYHPGLEIGNFEHMWDLKRRLNCKPFEYYLANVAEKNVIRKHEDVLSLGEVQSALRPELCLDLRNTREGGNGVGMQVCNQNGRGPQGWLLIRSAGQIRLIHLWITDHEELCLAAPNRVVQCNDASSKWQFVERPGRERDGRKAFSITWKQGGTSKCLAPPSHSPSELQLQDCNEDALHQIFLLEGFPNHKWARPRDALKGGSRDEL